MVYGMYHLVDNCLTLFVIDYIEDVFVGRNAIGHVVDASGVGCIVVFVWFV